MTNKPARPDAPAAINLAQLETVTGGGKYGAYLSAGGPRAGVFGPRVGSTGLHGVGI